MTARYALLALIAATMLTWSPDANAQDPQSFRAEISYYIDADGTGMLIANPAPYGQGSISWAACPPGGGCYPVTSDLRSDRVLHVGSAGAGTVFVATAVNQSQVASASSVPYQGPVRSLTQPRIEGGLRVGRLVKPHAGTWGGGWGSETSRLQTQVCRSAGGSGCVVVADAVYWDECPRSGAVLTSAYRGRYLRVIDQRIGRDAVFPGFGVHTPAGLQPIEPGPAAAATVAGPIAPATAPPQSNCGLPPTIVLRTHPARRHGRLALGRITCPQACRVRVSIQQGKRRVHHRDRLPARPASQRLWLPARSALRLKSGLATVRVTIDGRTGDQVSRLSSRRRVTLP